ncbi:hypothetical protein YYG_01915 [Plasmodium vinckei petteri]|uniref:Uncharacterized protein n=1 Tax=Plasmodium vinckei petteri TaxID=138298 RepID=W7AM57_PLAVN|nr:hypothetical protein YYG_01915 [Plasmodium vinckei petteri]
MHKRDLGNNYYDANILANDLKVLTHDKFNNNIKKDLVKYERGSENKQLLNRERKLLMRFLYFNININKSNANADYGFELSKPLKKTISLLP